MFFRSSSTPEVRASDASSRPSSTIAARRSSAPRWCSRCSTTCATRPTSITSVLPLFDYDSTTDGKQAHVLTLLGGWTHDKSAGVSQWYSTIPPIFHRRDPQRTVDIAAPLYAHWSAKEDHSSGYFVLPFVRQATPRGSVNTFAGVFWHLTDTASQGTTSFLFPVAGFHQHPGAAGGFVGPLYAWGSLCGSFGAGVFRCCSSAGQICRQARGGMPSCFRCSSMRRTTARARRRPSWGPGFFHRRGPGQDQGWDAGIAPLVFFGGTKGGGYGGVVPLFFHSRTQRPTGFTPPTSSDRSTTRTVRTAMPAGSSRWRSSARAVVARATRPAATRSCSLSSFASPTVNAPTAARRTSASRRHYDGAQRRRRDQRLFPAGLRAHHARTHRHWHRRSWAATHATSGRRRARWSSGPGSRTSTI